MGTFVNPSANSPYLARFAIPRTGDDCLPGAYSLELKMWVTGSGDQAVPVIADGALNELMTKTNVNTEQDDDTFWQVELLTKTFQKVESDDEDPSPYRGQALPGQSEKLHCFRPASPLLQLVTKTEANVERDDRGELNHILELMTKTAIELERDDNGDSTLGLDTRYYKD